MTSIKIHNNRIIYQCDRWGMHQDKSFEIQKEEIRSIGFVNRMIGDDDSDVLVLIDNSYNKHFINLTFKFDELFEFKKWVNEQYNIILDDISTKNTDCSIIIYPEKYFGYQLYKKNLKMFLKKIFAIAHPADGILNSY